MSVDKLVGGISRFQKHIYPERQDLFEKLALGQYCSASSSSSSWWARDFSRGEVTDYERPSGLSIRSLARGSSSRTIFSSWASRLWSYSARFFRCSTKPSTAPR